MVERDVWVTASACGNCVEVMRTIGDEILVRDSKDRTQVIVFTADAWNTLVAGVKANQFDLVCEVA